MNWYFQRRILILFVICATLGYCDQQSSPLINDQNIASSEGLLLFINQAQNCKELFAAAKDCFCGLTQSDGWSEVDFDIQETVCQDSNIDFPISIDKLKYFDNIPDHYLYDVVREADMPAIKFLQKFIVQFPIQLGYALMRIIDFVAEMNSGGFGCDFENISAKQFVDLVVLLPGNFDRQNALKKYKEFIKNPIECMIVEDLITANKF